MAIRLQHVPKKTYDESSSHLMPRFSVSCPSWWNSNERQIAQSLTKNMTLKADPPPQTFYNAKCLGFQLPDQESSSAQSIGQSQIEVAAVGGVASQDQCISSESEHAGQEESCGKGMEGQLKPVFLLSNSEIGFNPIDYTHTHSVAHTSYPYAEHYFGGLFAPYGTQTLIQPQFGSHMVGIAPARVPLPANHADDGPIYVNPKQYHGILRRRQSRAKLEAQNKLVRTRKPYLHESRHLHALNRIRGSGGRFLSTKKLQQSSDSTYNTSTNSLSNSINFHRHRNSASECDGQIATSTVCSDITSLSNGGSDVYQPHNRRFSFGISAALQMSNGSGVLHEGVRHHASFVR